MEQQNPKAKKTKFVLIAIFIFSFLIVSGLLTYYLLTNKTEETEKEKNLEVSENDNFHFEKDTLDSVKKILEKYEIYEYFVEKENFVSDSTYAGMRWEDDSGEVGLIKNFTSINFDIYSAVSEKSPSYKENPEEYDSWMKIRDQKANHARDNLNFVLDETEELFLRQGFVKNENNFQNGISALEKDGFRCLIVINDSNWPQIHLECGDILSIEFPEGYSEMSKFFGRKASVEIYNLVDDFAIISRYTRPASLGGGKIIMRYVDGGWSPLLLPNSEHYLLQDLPECSWLFENGVPPELFPVGNNFNVCYDDSGTKEYKEYLLST